MNQLVNWLIKLNALSRLIRLIAREPMLYAFGLLAYHVYMFDAVFEVYIACLLKAEGLVEFPEV